jgi:pyridoxine 5-phosphate synthase
LISLSVNVNKIATVRNSRGGSVPSVLEAVKVCVATGAPGITVHPRADARHITRADVHDIDAYLRSLPMTREAADAARAGRRKIEFNIEGDPRPDLIDLVHAVKPDQCTLVPVHPGEITSQAGWSPDTPADTMRRVVSAMRDAGVRVSLFVDPVDAPIRWAADMGADRVELYTEPFARAFERGEPQARESFAIYTRAAELAHSLGLGVNAGHDLDLDNLVVFRRLPHLDEVSIGHALVSHALFVGLAQSVREYLDVLAL